ncbi:MAG: hypothetical protein HUJ61_05430 [Bacilli bacterium]|nr:hypothetical protein [Bacilli bacterium]
MVNYETMIMVLDAVSRVCEDKCIDLGDMIYFIRNDDCLREDIDNFVGDITVDSLVKIIELAWDRVVI